MTTEKASGDGKEKTAETVTEEELLKSVEALEAKTEKKPEEEDPEKKVETQILEKTVSEVVEEKASEELKKALEISETLAEFAGLIGAHVDESLEALQKSVAAAGDRDLAFLKVLTALKKSMDGMREEIAKFGEQPGTAKSVLTDEKTDKTEILQKTVDDGEKAKDPVRAKKQIQMGLDTLAKSAEEAERPHFLNAAVKFESTGHVEDIDALRAMQALKALSAAAS